ncbi:alpha/beta fold hydrolase [Homoserinibacter sp. YIM 151385]|uniref:alpha/beta fold hydrolase n=1 Tax=Homoserinibacter sp. YIM 151385 TaxID=2985506 RepID=UPI0022EFF3D0|nr:alpha/beta hydrolase [Homoserinibacter sp. YIM 151385]WBU38965.1 alpha/beta hydrolase [Homoserinibacter sp. YIM 151385]
MDRGAHRGGGRRGRRGPAGEDRYRERVIDGARYLTSRQEHESLTIVVERFPARRDDPADGDDPVFVLVHGLGVSSRYFRPLAAQLARRGRVFVVDLPGYGRAPDPRGRVSIADHARVLAGMLVELGLDRPVLVGHSMGAQVVAMLAAEHPGVTDRIVLMAPTNEPGRRRFWSATAHLLLDALREPPRVFAIAVTDYFLRCGPGYLLRQSGVMLADRIEDRMPGLDAKVLVLCGDRDAIVRAPWSRALAGLAPDAAFQEVAGAHVVMHTDPVTVAERIAEHASR